MVFVPFSFENNAWCSNPMWKKQVSVYLSSIMQMSCHSCFAFENILTVIKMFLFLGYNFPVLHIHTSLFILRFWCHQKPIILCLNSIEYVVKINSIKLYSALSIINYAEYFKNQILKKKYIYIRLTNVTIK